MGVGEMRERLVVLDPTPAALAIASLVRNGATATATTPAPHGYTTNDYVTVAGATPTGFNGRVKATVTGPLTFTYPVDAGLSTPATGTITVTYYKDAQGGSAQVSRTLDTIAAELVPLKAGEQLQARAIGSQIDFRFRVRARDDVRPKMKAYWTPAWPPSSERRTIEIHGILPDKADRRMMFLECGMEQ